jgi:hypothetical protein
MFEDIIKGISFKVSIGIDSKEWYNTMHSNSYFNI